MCRPCCPAACGIQFLTRDWTRVPCISWQILNHRTTREVPIHLHFVNGWNSIQTRVPPPGAKRLFHHPWLPPQSLPRSHTPEVSVSSSSFQNWIELYSSAGKESVCNAGDLGSIPGLWRSPGEGDGYPLQYFGLENSTDRGVWQATVHGVTELDRTEWLSLHIIPLGVSLAP